MRCMICWFDDKNDLLDDFLFEFKRKFYSPIHKAVILANFVRSLGVNPLMKINTFFISSSNIFSKYLYRRMSLMKTYRDIEITN